MALKSSAASSAERIEMSVGEFALTARSKRFAIQLRLRHQRTDLASRMDTGVGATAAGNCEGFTSDLLPSFF